MTPPFKKHSTQIGHTEYCACDQCRHAMVYNQKLRKAGYRSRYPVAPVRAHLNVLYEAAGRAMEPLMDATGLPWGTLNNVMYAQRDHIQNATAVAIFAVDPENVQPKRFSYARYMWRLHTLNAQGFSLPRLSAMAGARLAVNRDRNRNANEFVSRDKWEALDRLYQTIGERMADPVRDGIPAAEINRAAATAKRNRQYPRAAYENEYDPKPAKIDGAWELLQEDTRHVEELVERRMNVGMTPQQITDDLGPLYPDVKDFGYIMGRVRANKRNSAVR